MSSRRLVNCLQRRLLGNASGMLREYPRLFVVGCPRSGTTWVTQMLGAHPNSIFTRESQAYGLAQRVLEPIHWSDAVETRVAFTEAYERQKKQRVGLHNYVTSREFAACLSRSLDWALSRPQCSNLEFGMRVVQEVYDLYFWKRGGTADDLFIEKSPSHSLYAEDILRYYPSCRVLHVVRDGRDVCVSMQMRSLATNWSPAERENQINTWLTHVQAARRAVELPEFSDRVSTVRYEDLHANPEHELRRIMDFAQLEASPQLLASILDQTSFDRKSRTGPGRHSYKGVVGEWRHHFSPEDLSLYESLAGDLHQACGYATDWPRRAA